MVYHLKCVGDMGNPFLLRRGYPLLWYIRCRGVSAVVACPLLWCVCYCGVFAIVVCPLLRCIRCCGVFGVGLKFATILSLLVCGCLFFCLLTLCVFMRLSYAYPPTPVSPSITPNEPPTVRQPVPPHHASTRHPTAHHLPTPHTSNNRAGV